MAGNRRRRRVWKWILGIAAFLIVLELILNSLPPHTTSWEFCYRCGLERRVNTALEPSDDVRLKATRMSRWYEENISTPHEHKWEMFERTIENRGFLIQTVSFQDRLPVGRSWLDSEGLVYFLELLRKHNLHKEYFRLLTSDDEDTRRTAWEACSSIPSRANDVREWWSELQRAIEDADSEAREARRKRERA